MVRVGYYVFSLWEDSGGYDERNITATIKKVFARLSIPYKIIIPKPVKYKSLHDWKRENCYRCSVVMQEPVPQLLYLNDETFDSTFNALRIIIQQSFPDLEIPVTLFKEFSVCNLDKILL